MSPSLLVPCHNAANFLPRLWQSVRLQSIPFSEFICYDDASTDSTADVARSLGARVIRGDKKRGVAHARNILWRSAASEWVHFHDADDLLTHDFVERINEPIADETDVVICNATWLDEASQRVTLEWIYSDRALQENPVSYLLTHPVGGINGVYKKTILERIGGFDETLEIWEDADLHVRLANTGARFRVVEKALAIALRQPNGASSNALVNWRCRLRCLRNYSMTLPECHSKALLIELDRAARELVSLKDIHSASDAANLARELGGELPITSSKALVACRKLFGPTFAMRMQRRIRLLLQTS